VRLIRPLLLLLGICCVTSAQQISYFNYGFLRQPSAAADRAYLGIGPGSGGVEVNSTWPITAVTNGALPALVTLSFDQTFTNGLATVSYVDASGTVISNALFALIPTSSGALWATVIAAGTNVVVLTNSVGGTNSYTINALTDTNIVNSLSFIQAQNVTNGLATIAFAESLTNNFDTISDVNSKLVSATNNALLLATNNDTVVSNAVFLFAQQQTNNFETISAAQALTNNFDTIADVNSKTNSVGQSISDATNGLAIPISQRVLTNDTRNLVLTSSTNRIGTNISADFYYGDGSHLTGLTPFASVVAAGTNATVITNSASGTNSYTVSGRTDTNVVNILAATQAQSLTNLPVAGMTWLPYSSGDDTAQYRGIAYGNGVFVAVQTSQNDVTPKQAITSADRGVTWVPHTTLMNNSVWVDVVYGGQGSTNQFVAVSSGGNDPVMTSPNGTNWAGQVGPFASIWNCITYGNPGGNTNLFVAGGGGTQKVMTSPDGTNWVAQSFNGSAFLGLAYGSNLFVGVNGSTTLTSPDGTNWTTHATSDLYSRVVFANGLFVASGPNAIGTSIDGTNFVKQSSLANSGYGIAFGNGIWVASGSSTAFWSRDATNWQTAFSTPTGLWKGIAYGGGAFASISSSASGGLHAMRSANPSFVVDGLTNYNGTASRIAMYDANQNLGSATASGAVPIDANGTATTYAQITALGTFLTTFAQVAATGPFLTNNESLATVHSNTLAVDAAHQLIASNLTTGRVLVGRADSGITNVAASGSVPIDADGSATTSGQINTVYSGNSSVFHADDITNNVQYAVANVVLTVNDTFVLLTGAHTATMPDPAAAGASGKFFWIQCASAGTNAILRNGAETFNVPGVQGATKLTNTAIGRAVLLWSNRTNWWGTLF